MILRYFILKYLNVSDYLVEGLYPQSKLPSLFAIFRLFHYYFMIRIVLNKTYYNTKSLDTKIDFDYKSAFYNICK